MGRSVNDLIDGLRKGTIKADDLPPIRIFERNGQIFSLDNRRLYAFREANIPVRTRPATLAEIQNESFKFTSTNGGISIRVRGENIRE